MPPRHPLHTEFFSCLSWWPNDDIVANSKAFAVHLFIGLSVCLSVEAMTDEMYREAVDGSSGKREGSHSPSLLLVTALEGQDG